MEYSKHHYANNLTTWMKCINFFKDKSYQSSNKNNQYSLIFTK